jgi:hypothetical protein
MMLGVGLANRLALRNDPAARRELTLATAMTAALFIVMAVLLYRARVLFVSVYPSLTWTGIVLICAAAVALAAVALSGANRPVPALMAVSAAVVLLTVQFGGFAGKRPEAVEQIAAMIHANRFGGEPIGQYRTFVRNLPFYTHLPQREIGDDTAAVAFLQSSERVFLVLKRPDFERLGAIGSVPL